MRTTIIIAILGMSLLAAAQEPKAAAASSSDHSALRNLLLQELRETHNEKNWFVSEKEAVEGLTPEQAAWNDGKNHSAGQLVEHMVYWNSANLARLKHQPTPKTPDNNVTFNFDAARWQKAQQDFDQTMTDLENFVQSADDATLLKIAPTIARIAQHNAYHIGEIVTSRKKQGSWDPENGVK
jgi:hypothetical protein